MLSEYMAMFAVLLVLEYTTSYCILWSFSLTYGMHSFCGQYLSLLLGNNKLVLSDYKNIFLGPCTGSLKGSSISLIPLTVRYMAFMPEGSHSATWAIRFRTNRQEQVSCGSGSHHLDCSEGSGKPYLKPSLSA